MIWPPEVVYLSPDGEAGPKFIRHRGGFVQGHPGRVCVMKLNRPQKGKAEGSWYWWPVCNRHGAYATLAQAVRLYDPFQVHSYA